MIVVDNRWTGLNGIGRYANEVLPRLTVPWVPISGTGSPSSPYDFLTKSLKVEKQTPSCVYSPGYNGFLRNVPHTITIHDLIHLHSPHAAKYIPYYNLFLKPLIRRNRHVITNSQTSKLQIERWLDDAAVTVLNAGMGIAPGFQVMGRKFASERPYFVYVGNLKAHKNVETIIEAIGYVDDADLYLVTADTMRAEQLTSRHGVIDRVHILNGIDDPYLARLYRGARAVVQPSLLEGFGLPALEGALCGTPIVFSEACDSVREICAGGGHAVADARDAHQWASAMAEIGENERFPSGLIGPLDYSWDSVARIVSKTLEKYL